MNWCLPKWRDDLGARSTCAAKAMPVVGFLNPACPGPAFEPIIDTFRRGLADTGMSKAKTS
jgi:hypothetical protein